MIVRYSGGLGNQLFQYAFGKAVKEQYGCSLRFDVTFYLFHRARECGIGKLNIRERQRISLPEVLLYNGLYYIKPLLPFLFVRDRDFFVYQRIKEKDSKKYFSGIWQVTAYFDHVREELKKEFTLTHPSDAAEELRKRILEEAGSVAIHVRRGDYLTECSSYVVQDMEYYRKAIAIVGGHLQEPVFYVFSDDLNWCREHFAACGCELRFVEGFSDVEDFILMRACRNHIISNSTFSWWPAYLSDEGMKVAPSQWFHRKDWNMRIGEGLLGGFICV